jgi:hypothetical protein
MYIGLLHDKAAEVGKAMKIGGDGQWANPSSVAMASNTNESCTRKAPRKRNHTSFVLQKAGVLLALFVAYASATDSPTTFRAAGYYYQNFNVNNARVFQADEITAFERIIESYTPLYTNRFTTSVCQLEYQLLEQPADQFDTEFVNEVQYRMDWTSTWSLEYVEKLHASYFNSIRHNLTTALQKAGLNVTSSQNTLVSLGLPTGSPTISPRPSSSPSPSDGPSMSPSEGLTPRPSAITDSPVMDQLSLQPSKSVSQAVLSMAPSSGRLDSAAIGDEEKPTTSATTRLPLSMICLGLMVYVWMC